jgi:hypothetical protein
MLSTMEPRRTVTIEIFDPPMCCPTGLCGPSVDPALLDIYEAILKIKAEYDGRATVERYVLGQQPAKFMQQPEIVQRLKAHGVAVLPITLVNGQVQKEHVYPSYADLRRWIEGGATSAECTSAE